MLFYCFKCSNSSKNLRWNSVLNSPVIPGPGNGTSQLPRNELLRRSTRKSTRSRSGQQAAASGANMRYAGDLFTKVSIGRTKSFVKTGNQYNLQELFRELKVNLCLGFFNYCDWFVVTNRRLRLVAVSCR